MKKFILATCLIIGLAAIRTVQGDEKPVVIEVVLHDKVKVRQPRSIVQLPVCRYNGFNNSVVVEFPDEDVSYTAMVVNTSTGEQWFEMGNGYVEIIISDAPGNYVIEIETDSHRFFMAIIHCRNLFTAALPAIVKKPSHEKAKPSMRNSQVQLKHRKVL